MTETDLKRSSKGQKRAWKTGAGQNKRKKGRGWTQLSDLKNGSSGFIVTTEQGREGKTQAQMLDWLNEVVERLEDTIGQDEENGNPHPELASISKGIEAEIEKTKKFHLVEPVQAHGKSVLVFRLKKNNVNPVKVVELLLEEILNSGTVRTPYAHSIRPVQSFCFASCEDLVKGPRSELLKSFLSLDNVTGMTFAVQPRLRGILHRNDVVETVVEFLKSSCGDGSDQELPLKVNLSKPDIVILVEAYKNIAGLSVIPAYSKMHNLSFAQALKSYEEKKSNE